MAWTACRETQDPQGRLDSSDLREFPEFKVRRVRPGQLDRKDRPDLKAPAETAEIQASPASRESPEHQAVPEALALRELWATSVTRGHQASLDHQVRLDFKALQAGPAPRALLVTWASLDTRGLLESREGLVHQETRDPLVTPDQLDKGAREEAPGHWAHQACRERGV